MQCSQAPGSWLLLRKVHWLRLTQKRPGFRLQFRIFFLSASAVAPLKIRLPNTECMLLSVDKEMSI